MKSTQFLNETTTAGSVASVSMPFKATQKRTSEDSTNVTTKKSKKKYANSLTEGKMKDLFVDLKLPPNGLSDEDFLKKYNKTKKEMRNLFKNKQEQIKEQKLEEEDLIIVPGQGRRLKSGFVPHGQSRVDHEVEMARSDLFQAHKNAKKIYNLIKDRDESEGLEGWVQEKIIKANDYLNTVREYLEHKTLTKEGMKGAMLGGVAGAVITKTPQGALSGANIGSEIEDMFKEEITSGGVIAGGGVGEGMAEGSGNWYIRVKGKVVKDKQFNAIPFPSKETATQKALEIHNKKRIPLDMIKLTQSWMDGPEQGVAEGYILKKTKVEKTFTPGDPDEYYTSGGADVTRKDTDYEIINNKTGQVVGTASWTTNDYFGPGALKITMKNGATRWLDIYPSEKGNPQTAFNRFVKDPKTAKKYKEEGMAEGIVKKHNKLLRKKSDTELGRAEIKTNPKKYVPGQNPLTIGRAIRNREENNGVAEGWKEKVGAAALAGSMALGSPAQAQSIAQSIAQGIGRGMTSAAGSSVIDKNRNAADEEFAKQIPDEKDRETYLKALKQIKHSRALAYSSPAMAGANLAREQNFKKLKHQMAEKYNILMPVKEQGVAEGYLNEFAPDDSGDDRTYEYEVYQCNPQDQFDWIGGPIYRSNDMGKVHSVAYELWKKHPDKAFMIWQERTKGSRGGYGIKDDEQGVAEGTGVTDYNLPSKGGTRKELLAKYHKTKNPKDAQAARKAGATQKELQGDKKENNSINEMSNDLAKDFADFLKSTGRKYTTGRPPERPQPIEPDLTDEIAKLPMLKQQYQDMVDQYNKRNGDSWRYADREQNLSPFEKENREMWYGPITKLWRKIQELEKAKNEQNLEEDSTNEKTFRVTYYSKKLDKNVTKKMKAENESDIWNKFMLKNIDVVSIEQLEDAK